VLDTVRQLLEHSPLLALFAAIGIGYAIGRISIAGFSLDIGAVLFAGLALGAIAPAAAPPALVSSIGLVMFLYGIGIQYGRQFFAGLAGTGLLWNAIAVIGVAAALAVTLAAVKAGDSVLVIAAGSGVGQAAIQIASLHGARVFATAGSHEKLERARELGAWDTIHHYEQDIAEEIKRLTNRRGVDVVIEHVGEATWPQSVRSLARGGRLVTCGATTGRRGTLDLAALFSKRLSILGSYMGTKGELVRAARHFFAGELKPVIDRTFPLAEAEAAQRRLEQSGQFGKIVLEVQ